MDGITHITSAFQAAKQAGHAALMPYLTLGYPNPELSLALVEADPDLSRPEHAAAREALVQRWADRLSLAQVG